MQAEREQAEFESEWEELGRMVEQDRRMKAFMAQVSEWASRQSEGERLRHLACFVAQERAKVTSHGLRGERRAVAEEAQQLKRKARTGGAGGSQGRLTALTLSPSPLLLTPHPSPLALPGPQG